ncbi:MAG: TolC family protein [Gammaproteobacteria bacterium]|nr:TolC family protein [Gammaproteobacteria bacterium]
MRIRLALSLLLAACSLRMAPAQDLVTMDQAVRYGLRHNLDLRASDQQLRAARARVGVAKSGRYPQINARYLVQNSDNPLDVFAGKLNTRSVDPATDFTAGALNNPGASTVNTTEIALQMPIYTGGKLGAAVRNARYHEQAVDFNLGRLRQETIFQIMRAYLAAQATVHGREIADDAVVAARGHVETTRRLVREGRIVVSDRMTAELNLAAVESARAKADDRVHLALDQLKLAMGMPVDDPIALLPWREPAVEPLDPLPVLEQRALAARKDLEAARSMVSASAASIDEAHAAFKPQVSLVATSDWYSHHLGFAANSQSIMGVVSINLFSGNRDTSELDDARDRKTESELRALNLQQDILNQVRAAYYGVREAMARRRIAAANVARARQTVRLVKKRYGEGRTILLDVLNAEQLLVEARNEKLASSLDLATNQAALALAEGTLAPPQ